MCLGSSDISLPLRCTSVQLRGVSRRDSSNGQVEPVVRLTQDEAQQSLPQPATKGVARPRRKQDQLQARIDGLGPVGASKLHSHGYKNFEQLAWAFQSKFNSDADALKKHLKARLSA